MLLPHLAYSFRRSFFISSYSIEKCDLEKLSNSIRWKINTNLGFWHIYIHVPMRIYELLTCINPILLSPFLTNTWHNRTLFKRKQNQNIIPWARFYVQKSNCNNKNLYVLPIVYDTHLCSIPNPSYKTPLDFSDICFFLFERDEASGHCLYKAIGFASRCGCWRENSFARLSSTAFQIIRNLDFILIKHCWNQSPCITTPSEHRAINTFCHWLFSSINGRMSHLNSSAFPAVLHSMESCIKKVNANIITRCADPILAIYIYCVCHISTVTHLFFGELMQGSSLLAVTMPHMPICCSRANSILSCVPGWFLSHSLFLSVEKYCF